MGWLKWVIILAGDFFLPPPGIPLFTILYLSYWIIKKVVLIDFYYAYLLFFGVPQIVLSGIIHFFLFLGKDVAYTNMKAIKFAEKPFKFALDGTKILEKYNKIAFASAILFGSLAFMYLPITMADIIGTTEIVNNLTNVLIIFAIATGIPILIAATINKVTDKNLTGEDKNKNKSLDRNYRSNEQPRNQKQQQIQDIEDKQESADIRNHWAGKIPVIATIYQLIVLRSEWVPNNVQTAATKLGSQFGLVDDAEHAQHHMAAGAGAAKAGQAAKRTGSLQKTAKAGAKGAKTAKKAKMLPAFLIGGLILLIQLPIITAIWYAFVTAYMPLIGGPFMAALGFGADYANYADQAVVDSHLPQFNIQAPNFVLQAVAQGRCALEGPECLSEWRMNNTMRPGSESVGQRYELEVDGFTVEGERTIDVAFEDPESSLNTRFAMYNPRFGLRGIPARDVQYRVNITDRSGNSYCSTDDYEPIDTLHGNNLAPGDSYVFTAPEEFGLTLRNCEMLQPGQTPIDRRATLEYKYDYSSQSTLRTEAMSFENMEELGITPNFEESETADTPVKSFLNIYSPIVFEQTPTGPNARPFEVQIGFTTERDVEYRIDEDSVRFTSSALLEKVDDGRCDFEEVDDEGAGDNVFQLDGDAKEDINRRSTDQGIWFDDRTTPGIFRCVMELEDQGAGINPSGEIVINDISANYTVKETASSSQFDAWNTLCSGEDCPFLVTAQSRQEMSDGDSFLSVCDPSRRADATGGCDVRPATQEEGLNSNPDDDGWADDWADWSQPTINFNTINRDEEAIRWPNDDIESYEDSSTTLVEPLPSEAEVDIDQEGSGGDTEYMALGTETSKYTTIKDRGDEEQLALVAYRDHRDRNAIHFQHIDQDLCLHEDEDEEQFTEDYFSYWVERHTRLSYERGGQQATYPLFFNLNIVTCEEDETSSYEEMREDQ